MKINLNHTVKVKLTDLGNKIYEDYLRSQYGSLSHLIGLIEIRVKKTEDQDGYIHFQLWEFMSIFGEHFYVGSEAVTEDNEIIVSDDTITIELQEQLRKARKKAKRWKRKYLELRYKVDHSETGSDKHGRCKDCKYAIMDYYEYDNGGKQYFVHGCKKDIPGDAECEEFEDAKV